MKMNQKKAPREPRPMDVVDKRKIMKRIVENPPMAEKKAHYNGRAGGDDAPREDGKTTNAQKAPNVHNDATLTKPQELEDDLYDDEKDSPFKQVPTLRVTRKQGNFRVMFQPIRVTQNEEPLLPIVFLTPDEWSDDEGDSSEDSDLDIEYMAPAAFMPQAVKQKPLVLMMKTYYDYAEVEKHIAATETSTSRMKDKIKKEKLQN